MGALLCAAEMVQRGITTSADDMFGRANVIQGTGTGRQRFYRSGLRSLSFEACERVSKEHGQLAHQENVDFIKKWNQIG